MKYLSTNQILLSVERLRSLHPFFGYAFLAFKKFGLPIGSPVPFGYQYIDDEILKVYYKPIADTDQYFSPFDSNKSWVSGRYASTSLQRIIADTFGKAFVREKRSHLWAFRPDYIQVLRARMDELGSSEIPLLDLAVWLYRDDPVDETDLPDIYLYERIVTEFNLDPAETVLFESMSSRRVELSNTPYSKNDLFNTVGWPEDYKDYSGAIIDQVNLENVGPSLSLQYSPSSRLNILTGDNSLGKTFLLDVAWWCLSGSWAHLPAEPSPRSRGSSSAIEYQLSSELGSGKPALSVFERRTSHWQRPDDRHEGVGLYATAEGGVSVWDSTSSTSLEYDLGHKTDCWTFSREEIWQGAEQRDRYGRTFRILNGLISDWATALIAAEPEANHVQVFEHCIAALSPPDGPQLRAAGVTKIPGDERMFPALRMPYGPVPLPYASSGIQRILGLAYILSWHWEHHLTRCRKARREPSKSFVLIIDEVEAHLHPKWQRRIVASLLETMKIIAPDVQFQIHLATHSPMVLTSLEPFSELGDDSLHILNFTSQTVEMERRDFVKMGSADAWLESEAFGLSSAKSVEAEQAIEAAKALQRQRNATRQAVQSAHRKLLQTLADDDPFWVRWNSFARSKVER
jgi:hypothetical protein